MRSTGSRVTSSSGHVSGFRRWTTLVLLLFAVGLIVLYEYYIIKYIADERATSQQNGEVLNYQASHSPSSVLNPVLKSTITPKPTQTQSNLRTTEIISPPPPSKDLQNREQEDKVERRILPDPISFSYNMKDSNPAVMIVGGTDGSGTRSVVQTLTDLGASVVSEDPETFDIHADLVGGWPPIVKPVLHDVRSLQYQMSSLSAGTRAFLTTSIQKLLNQVKADSTKPTSHRLAVGGRLPTPTNVHASRIAYGFKAPVAMTLLPIWTHFLPNCVFIHVVRDGRDIAFSVNQGPVEKFYNDFYKTLNNHLEPSIKAIQLWSDWNSDIYEYSKQYHQQLIKEQEKLKSFGYYLVHTEDLIIQDQDNIQIKFNTIYHLAKFIGSTLSNDQLCCLAKRNVQFMGSHDRTPIKRQQQQQQQQVKSRYGKWRNHVANNPNLLSDLLYHGKRGLKFFGYEPMRKLPEAVVYPEEHNNPSIDGLNEENPSSSLPKVVYVTKDGYECKLTNKQCQQYYPESFNEHVDDPLPQDVSSYTANGECEIQRGIDYKGDDIDAISINENDPAACCR